MPLALFRKSEHHDELARLANKHIQSDLEPSDRDALLAATKRISNSTVVGSLIGVGLGLYAAIRLRRVRTEMFAAFRTAEKPSFVVFPNGRQESVPDITHLMRPTRLGDLATYFFFGLGGTLVGGELGLLGGTWSASRGLASDSARRDRIEAAYRALKVEILRKEAERLESGGPALLV